MICFEDKTGELNDEVDLGGDALLLYEDGIIVNSVLYTTDGELGDCKAIVEFLANVLDDGLLPSVGDCDCDCCCCCCCK